METNSFVNVRKNCTQKSLELHYKIMLINIYTMIPFGLKVTPDSQRPFWLASEPFR